MLKRFLIVQLALGFTASAQIGPPSLGLTGGPGRQVLEIQGIPEAWVARPVLGGAADAAASSSLQLCWTSHGTLSILNKQTRRVGSYPVPQGDARFAFDARGQLSAAWFLNTGEIYTRAAGWNAIYTSAGGAVPLDLNVKPRAVVLLYRSEAGLYRTWIDVVSGDVLAETRLEDRSGPALLDSGSNAVFAASSGLSAVDSMRHVEQGWSLLSTAHGLWLWQPGKQPQGVPTASGATPALQLWPPDGSRDVGDTVVMPNTPVGSTTRVEYVLSNTGSTDLYLSTLHLTTAAPFKLDGARHGNWIKAGLLQGFFILFSPSALGAATPSSLTINYCTAVDFDTTNNACPTSAIIARSIAVAGTGLVAPASGPWLTGISPESNLAGAPDFTLFVNGGGFTSGSSVLWNGTPLATTFNSSLQLSAVVPASLLVAPADANVTVSNPPGSPANTTKAWRFSVYSSLTPSIALFDQNDAPLTPSQFASNMTVRVRIKLDQAAATSLSGVLQLSFTPGLGSVSTDQAIALGSPGSNQQVGNVQQFTIPAASRTAQFGNLDYVTLTTGTTAGTVTLALDLQYALPISPENYVINPAPVVILKSSKVTTERSTVLSIEGYDNTRSVSSITFTFLTASGGVVSPGAMKVDVTQDFARYFQANALLGGSFALTATFPTTGDSSKIASVTTVLQNGAGTTSAP